MFLRCINLNEPPPHAAQDLVVPQGSRGLFLATRPELLLQRTSLAFQVISERSECRPSPIRSRESSIAERASREPQTSEVRRGGRRLVGDGSSSRATRSRVEVPEIARPCAWHVDCRTEDGRAARRRENGRKARSPNHHFRWFIRSLK
jgi:hypothetical protein